ncbi:MAG: hemerythrin domain-containing protein [Polyangia bacterium]
MEPDEPFPSEVREMNLEEHRRLRESAAELAAHVRGCDCASLRKPIAESIAALLDQLRRHLDHEDATLGPLLAHIDPWGAERAARLGERRRIELGRLAEMIERLSEPMRDGPLREHVLRFVDWIENELSREEREHLDADLLRDDPMTRDSFGG